MNRNLLVVEDDGGIRNLIAMYFQNENFNIYEAEDGKSALSLFRSYPMDLVILDIMIPEIDGYKVCETIRTKSDVPVIMLTAKSQEEDKLRGFENGTDEYVTKPFSLKVLVARANALLKRTEGKISNGRNAVCFGNLIVDYHSGKVTVENREIALTPKEFDLLDMLIQNRDLILPKSTILDKVWGYDYEGDPRTLDTHIRRLREKLGSAKVFIKTVKGRGYCFESARKDSFHVQK